MLTVKSGKFLYVISVVVDDFKCIYAHQTTFLWIANETNVKNEFFIHFVSKF